MYPAARQTDPHGCPNHGVSPIDSPCEAGVLIENKPAARQGDAATCPTGPDAILDGSPTVLIGNKPAARVTEKCAHGGAVLFGANSVFIGNPAVGPNGMAIQVPPECAFLKDFGNKATGGTLHRLRDQYSWSSRPAVVSAKPQRDQPAADFKAQVVVIRGHSVTIYEPLNGAAPPQWLPTVDSVAQALATLSDEQLRNVKEVYITPYGRTDRPGTIADYNEELGRIRYFPQDSPQSQKHMDWVMQHEAGHGYWFELLRKDPSLKDAWQRAWDKDHRSTTEYGDTHIQEDFADFMVLFSSVKGTPCEASAKALFPNRWALMEKLFPNGLPTRNPRYTQKRY